jgi:hypothetical protein
VKDTIRYLAQQMLFEYMETDAALPQAQLVPFQSTPPSLVVAGGRRSR